MVAPRVYVNVVWCRRGQFVRKTIRARVRQREHPALCVVGIRSIEKGVRVPLRVGFRYVLYSFHTMSPDPHSQGFLTEDPTEYRVG